MTNPNEHELNSITTYLFKVLKCRMQNILVAFLKNNYKIKKARLQ